jgi:hypothetical protein
MAFAPPLQPYSCAWGNVAVNEVYPRRDYCWLKTISNPPLLAHAAVNFWLLSPFGVVSAYNAGVAIVHEK